MADEQNRSDARPDLPPDTTAGTGTAPRPPQGSVPTGTGKDDPSQAAESGDKKATG